MREATITYVGADGTTASVTGPRIILGIGIERKHHRNWLYHFCFGYVSGFPVPAILYYIATRHTTKAMKHWYWAREHEEFERTTGQIWDHCHRTNCPKCRSVDESGDN